MNLNWRYGQPWSIILAGREGEHRSTFVQRWMGSHNPEQYHTVMDGKSMLEHTVHRAEQLTSARRLIFEIQKSQEREGWLQPSDQSYGKVIRQPANRDTAAGILLPVAYVRARDPRGTVVFYPSDDFVYPEAPFVNAVRYAVHAVEQFPERLVLIGIVPNRMEMEYEWIWPGRVLDSTGGCSVLSVERYRDKPSSAEAWAGIASGAFWNTHVFVGRVETLWQLGWCYVPGIVRQLEGIGDAFGTAEEDSALECAYHEMPTLNFSTELLTRATSHLAMVELTGVIWSGRRRRERTVDTLDQLREQPISPLECLPCR